MKSRKTWIYLITALVVLGISAGLYMLSHPSPSGTNHTQAQTDQGMIRFEATRENLSNAIEIRGKSAYAQEKAVYAPFASTVREWHVKDGAQVNKGEVLFELDSEEMNREIAKLNANIRKQELEASVRRAESKLSESTTVVGTITDKEAFRQYSGNELARRQDELDAVQLASARAQIQEMKAKADQAHFVAPESGIFLFYDEKEPQQVKEKERVGSIVELSKLKLTCTVTEFEVFRIREGMPVEVRVEALKEAKMRGTIESVSKFAKTKSDSSASAEFEVVVALEPNERLIAGLSLTGTIETDRKEGALVIPTLAVLRDKDEYYVMLQTPQGLERRTIRIGIETAEKTEILEGLQEGDTVVLQ
jgi:membrane fusion protein, macrolide-specific efflux system